MIRYTLSLLSPSSHLFEISIVVPTSGYEYIDLEIPAWSPGRYFIYDFARNLQALWAASDGKNLSTEKIAKGTWRIHCHGCEEITVSYKMFGDTLSGTFSQLDDRHAAINGASVFGYIVGRTAESVELEIHHPDNWRVFTSMKRKRRRGHTVYVATNYDELIDSPIEAGTPTVRTFTHDDVVYHIIVDIAAATESRRSREVTRAIDRFVEDTRKTVIAYTTTFGKPEFDDYYFLVNIDPYASNGDGMEHLASTRLVLSGYITNDDHYHSLVGVMSHEFFHIWNVKRLRPVELGPFEYAREHHTTLLWFAEGFTQYYGHLMLRRAGVWDDKAFLKELVSEVNAVDRSPGRAYRNLRESSFDTWHAVGARNPMAAISNYKNTYVNYYHKGAIAALVLDMEIRRLSADRCSLDDLVRELYRRTYAEAEFEQYYLRGHGYTEEDVLDAVQTLVGTEGREILSRLIEGTEEIDYGRYLGYVGMTIARGKEGGKEGEKHPQIYTGLVLPEARSRSTRELLSISNVLEGSPAATAGLSAGDILLAVDDERVDGKTWDSVMAMKRPGDTVTLTIFRGPRLLSYRLKLQEQDTRPFRIDLDKEAPTPRKRSRARWLSPSVSRNTSTRPSTSVSKRRKP